MDLLVVETCHHSSGLFKEPLATVVLSMRIFSVSDVSCLERAVSMLSQHQHSLKPQMLSVDNPCQ
jgi:hypothetical protein